MAGVATLFIFVYDYSTMAVRVSVIGASGYGGAEAVRLLATHPEARLAHLTAETQTGRRFSDLYPNLRGFVDLVTEEANPAVVAGDSDVLNAARHWLPLLARTFESPFRLRRLRLDCGKKYGQVNGRNASPQSSTGRS